jgi:uncharacterized protein with ParB-like and HNH nuclease domain
MAVLDDVNKHRNDIVTDTYTVTWREIIGQYKDGDLIINPEYQRLFRWDIDQQTQYIESILLAIPSPPLFLAKNDDGRSEVIDGLQRISTVLKLFAGDIFEHKAQGDDEKNEIEQNDITKPTCLAEGRIVTSLEGFTAATLPETLVRTIRYGRITIILLEKESTPKARYEVFRRLNKLGSQLSDQEIRNCTARLLGKEFPDQLRKIAEKPVIRDVLALSDDASRRMGGEEALLRLLALSFSQQKLKHQIREYLDDFMEYAAEGKFKLTAAIERQLERTFDLIHEAIPDGRAFRLYNQGFSTNLFDVVATGVFSNIDSLTPEVLKEKFSTLQRSQELKALVGAGSNTRRKMQGRIDLGKKWFA